MNTRPSRQEIERIAETKRLAELNKEKLTALAQPHRRGDGSNLTDAFGIFLRYNFGRYEQDLMQKCWEAGQSYTLKVARLRRVKGIPQHILYEDETPSSGNTLDEKTVAVWEEEMRQYDNAMKCSGDPGFRAARSLILVDIMPKVKLFGPVKRAVIQLAICLGLFTEEKRND